MRAFRWAAALHTPRKLQLARYGHGLLCFAHWRALSEGIDLPQMCAAEEKRGANFSADARCDLTGRFGVTSRSRWACARGWGAPDSSAIVNASFVLSERNSDSAYRSRNHQSGALKFRHLPIVFPTSGSTWIPPVEETAAPKNARHHPDNIQAVHWWCNEEKGATRMG